jgi:hypothetical protein
MYNPLARGWLLHLGKYHYNYMGRGWGEKKIMSWKLN